MARPCNCGGKMTPESFLDFPKIYVCTSCGATLQIDKQGCITWYDKSGNQRTYDPQKNKEREK